MGGRGRYALAVMLAMTGLYLADIVPAQAKQSVPSRSPPIVVPVDPWDGRVRDPSSPAVEIPIAVRHAEPIGDPGIWFGPKAYPRAALRAHEEGRVIFILDLNSKGVPTACNVTTGSGSAALDAGTCAIARAHLRFRPAYDKNGKAIGTTYLMSIRWVIPT